MNRKTRGGLREGDYFLLCFKWGEKKKKDILCRNLSLLAGWRGKEVVVLMIWSGNCSRSFLFLFFIFIYAKFNILMFTTKF